ncbi:MAG: PilC/PilY family type IV pilus protein [Dokdonella sp.]
MKRARFNQSLALSALSAIVCVAAGLPVNGWAQVITPGTVDLLTTPPELTTSVDPNIVVTFDDSGSMASAFMGDNRPYDNSGWSSPYECAGVIGGAPTNPLVAHSMNGVYYNPNVLYVPPIKADGTSFPAADATLKTVQNDGITANRPLNPSGAGTTTNFIVTGSSRWKCLADGTSPTPSASGGAYYYRLKASVGAIAVDAFGNPTTAGRGVLFTPGNWEYVVINPAAAITLDGVATTEGQNWANWWAYYHTRNLMTRSALSRVFSTLTSVHVSWQNINDGNFLLPNTSIITSLLDKAGVNCATTDPKTTQTTATPGVQPDCYRSAFYNWIFQVPASGSTPDRLATIRAGEFFKRVNTTNLRDPYWQPPDLSNGITVGRELSCRQNFNMLVTDGYWNEGNPSTASIAPAFFGMHTPPPTSLPDGRTFSVTAPESRVYWNVPAAAAGNSCGSDNSADCYPSLADIAYYYWATDLRPGLSTAGGLDDKVKPYLPDKTIGVTGLATASISPPISNNEIYFNPNNDPASWQHVVQFMVTLGVSGKLQYSADADCVDPNNDLCKVRKGLANSLGTIGWPQPQRNNPNAIDDTWHAAINSRGSYFSASNPSDLVSHLNDVIHSVVARGASSTPVSVSLPILTGSSSGYAAGYDSSDWSGTVRRENLDALTAESTGIDWDAGCILTGGTCTSPPGTNTARNPNSRVIVTSYVNGSGTTVGLPFRWSSLQTAQKYSLNQKPVATTACDATHAGNCDNYGSDRVDYVRGVRTQESSAAAPHLRPRNSVLGAVINGQPVYVSSPRGGYHDIFPVGSPEDTAAVGGSSYARYQNVQKTRAPMVYVGSDDGMLHAFDAGSGDEKFAYVPNTLIQNVRLTKSTAQSAGLTPGVDSAPREADVFINGAWHTILVGSLRLGGRGIYALDVTNPNVTTEAGAASALPLWEFTNGTTASTAGDPACVTGSSACASLGYTYDSANVVRLKYQNPGSGNSWVALVSSGYFPSRPEDAASPADATEAAANRTSLMVIDVQTGKLIREIKTSLAPQTRPIGFKTYGMSTPMVYDLSSDEVGDLAYAGDLAGNLWRFDLTDPNPANWKVDLMFTTYGNGGAVNVGDQPIQFNPTALRDPVTRRPMILFGTGKYVGRPDRTSTIAAQAFYGIRDYGTAPSNGYYPINNNQLVTRLLTENAALERRINGWTPPVAVPSPTPPGIKLGDLDASGNPILINVPAQGWRLPLNFTNGSGTAVEPGERAQRRVIPLPSANLGVLYTLIPKGDDPCDPGARYGVMVVDAVSGAAVGNITGVGPPGNGVVGQVTDLPFPPGDPVTPRGGGELIIPGLSPILTGSVKQALNAAAPTWHRGAWRELLDLQ